MLLARPPDVNFRGRPEFLANQELGPATCDLADVLVVQFDSPGPSFPQVGSRKTNASGETFAQVWKNMCKTPGAKHRDGLQSRCYFGLLVVAGPKQRDVRPGESL
jgi:hypothetical protein